MEGSIFNYTKIKPYASIWISALLVICITLSVYIPSLQHDFVDWDDDEYVYKNNQISPLDYNSLKGAFTSVVSANWHPVTMISYSLDYTFWGLNPLGYHLTNIIFHTANTLLVFIFVIKLTGIEKKLTAAIITALLFGIHPLHVESVAWISERKDVLYAFFYLLSMLFYIKYALLTDPLITADNKKRHIKFYSVSCILFILSLLSKPMAVSLPFVLLLLDICPLKRFYIPYISPSCKEGIQKHSIKKVLMEKIPFIAISILSSAVTIWAQNKGNALQTMEASPFIDRLSIAARAYIFYLYKMIIPINLAPFYPNTKHTNLYLLESLGAFLLLIFITYVCLKYLSQIFSVIWFYYLITLFPVIGVVQIGSQVAADRYTYLPVLGFFILAGIGIQNIFNQIINKRYLIILFITGIISIFFIIADMTIKQISVWKNSLTLWSYELNAFPNTALPYIKLGIYYNNLNNYDQSISYFNKAISLHPSFAATYYNRGVAYGKLNNYQQAIDDFSNAISLHPEYAAAYNNRGLAYAMIKDYNQSISDFIQAVKIDPQDATAYYNRGLSYFNMHAFNKAIEDYLTAIKINPGYAAAYHKLSLAYSKLGDIGLSNEFAKKAKELGFH